MKKIFTLLFVLAATLCANAKDVPYYVGSTTFTTPYYGEVSDILPINKGQTGHFKFVNYNNNGGNWNNYAIVINEAGTDKIILRADNWENVQAGNDGCVSDFNWDTFVPDMNGATITTDILYENGVVTITNEIKTTSQKTYHYSFSKGGFNADYVDMKLTVDNSYLIVQEQSVTGGSNPDTAEVLYTVGSKDFTTPYYGAVSDILPVYDGQTGHFKFANYNNNGGNWNNYAIVINEAGTDKIILRADNWENVQAGNDGCVCDFNWDTFVPDMNGATITSEINYANGIVTITNEILTRNHTTYHYSFSKDGFSADYVDMKLTVDGSYLEVLEQGVTGGNTPGDEYTTVTDGTTTDYYPIVGATDCSTPWWTEFSELYNIEYGDTAHFQFVNYTSGENNWNNWALLIRTPEVEGDSSFTEYVVYRADAFGWGDYYDGGKNSSNYNWDTFKTDMNGALVDVYVTLNSGKVTVKSTANTTTGKSFFCNYETKPVGEPEAIAAQFTVENAYLAASPNMPSTGINTVETVSAVKKMVENNQVVIMKNGKKYNTAGAMLR